MQYDGGRMSLVALRRFFALESSGGLVMMLAAAAAMLVANSSWDALYHSAFPHAVLLWINDGLMAVFFLLVGLEIKREVVEGELSSRERLTLPIIAALGGIGAAGDPLCGLQLGRRDRLARLGNSNSN